MPITLTVSEGLLSKAAQAEAFAGLTDTLLKVTGLAGNPFMTPNVIGTIHELPGGQVLSGGRPVPAAFIELKLPSIALSTPDTQQAFIEEATTILERAAGGKLERQHIWVNVVHAVDGSWGIGGRGYSNADLIGAIQGVAA